MYFCIDLFTNKPDIKDPNKHIIMGKNIIPFISQLIILLLFLLVFSSSIFLISISFVILTLEASIYSPLLFSISPSQLFIERILVLSSEI